MAFPSAADRPRDASADTPLPSTPPVIDTAPPLAPPAPEQSPWWSAPSGRPVGIPDFAHEFAVLLAWLLRPPPPVPVPVKARRR